MSTLAVPSPDNSEEATGERKSITAAAQIARAAAEMGVVAGRNAGHGAASYEERVAAMKLSRKGIKFGRASDAWGAQADDSHGGAAAAAASLSPSAFAAAPTPTGRRLLDELPPGEDGSSVLGDDLASVPDAFQSDGALEGVGAGNITTALAPRLRTCPGGPRIVKVVGMFNTGTNYAEARRATDRKNRIRPQLSLTHISIIS